MLNYGHNNPVLRGKLVEYIQRAGITHSLDMHSKAKREFLESLEQVILKPRGMEYRVMFPGPTGTNAVESALKIARKVTGRHNVVSFTNGFHGMTLGALACTGNAGKRAGANVPLNNTTHLPFDGYFGDGVDTLDYFEHALTDRSSGLDKPAAVILETVQAEGGVNVASVEWLKRLEKLCVAHGVLLIADDIQVGNGRTGPFFSFERAGWKPDIVTVSKSLSGYGTPLAIVLIRPDLDQWSPGEHNGTFRGHNLAFVTAKAALDHFWTNDSLRKDVEKKSAFVKKRFEEILKKHDGLGAHHRGLGFIQGIAFDDPNLAGQTMAAAFERGLVIECAGAESQVVKFLAPLVIEQDQLARGMDILEESVAAVAKKAASTKSEGASARA